MTSVTKENTNNQKNEASQISRLEARVSSEQKYLFQKAANLSGLTLTDFLIVALRDMSLRVVHEHETMNLVDKDRQIFIQSLLEPPAPNDLLIKAAYKYQKEVTAK